MPVVALIGAYVGSSLGVGTMVGSLGGSMIGGAIGGGIGAEIQGGNFADGFKTGAIGGLIGGVAGEVFGTGGFGVGDSQASMLAEQYAGFAPADAAAHMASSGLSAAEMTSVLGDMGIDYNTAESYVNNATNSSNPYADISVGPDINNSNSIYSNFDFSIQDQFNALGQDGGFPPSPDKWWTGEGLDNANLESMFNANADAAKGTFYEGNYDLNNGVPYEVGKPVGTLEQAGGTMAQGASIENMAPIVEAGPASTGSAVNPFGNKPVPTTLSNLWSGAKGIAGELMPKDFGGMQLGMAGLQTIQDWQNANKLKSLAAEAGKPYQAYMDTFSNPDKYWNEYMQGQGALEYNKGSRQMAKAGRTGTLPSLYTTGHQNYMASALPQIRQGLATGANLASANMQQQAYPMQMKSKALSNIPSALTTNALINILGSRK